MTETVGNDQARRFEQEIERYRDCVNVHDLPAIFHVWSRDFIMPKLHAGGFTSVDDFYFRHALKQCFGPRKGPHRIVSLGSGNCDVEVQLGESLLQVGADVHVHCLELNPHMLERGEKLAAERGLADRFTFEEANLDEWRPEQEISIALANHSLHHLVQLEEIFAALNEALGEEGLFMTNDMIGRNGHMRWPEALAILEDIWARIPEHYKYNHQLARQEDDYVNWDCSVEGNEGIRAEDILPLLLETFSFETFIAFGNVIDPFVDRCFGHNLDDSKPEDVEFILETGRLDEAAIDDGVIKPTHMIAAMRTRDAGPVNCWKHWTPEFCVRPPEGLAEAAGD